MYFFDKKSFFSPIKFFLLLASTLERLEYIPIDTVLYYYKSLEEHVLC